MMKQLKLGLIGAGERGANSYAPYALQCPKEVTFTCVAEPLDDRRARFAADHKIADEMQFTDWPQMLEKNPNLDGIIIATQDRDHYAPAMACIEKGYHLLLEKPMAETAARTKEIVDAARRQKTLLMVCHVLRHTAYYQSMRQAIEDGAIGDVMSVHHIENIGFWHFAHSFVRGNWNNSEETTPMFVAKCCHDTDLINYLIGADQCKRISSFGSLPFFTAENKPEGAPPKCTDGCPHEDTCIYCAYRYLEKRKGRSGFKDIVFRTDDDKIFLEHLKDSPYSNCVYQCRNDVAGRQVVNIEYENGVTASVQACAFTMDICRQTKIMGTKGEIEGCMEDQKFYIKDFASGQTKTVETETAAEQHGGGDIGLMKSFLHALRDPNAAKHHSAGLSLLGHTMAYAAEYSRLHGGIPVNPDEYIR